MVGDGPPKALEDTGEEAAGSTAVDIRAGSAVGRNRWSDAWNGLLLRSARTWPDLVLAGLLAAATFVVHDVAYMLSAPFWTDEAWVAVSTKFPLSELPQVTASTPIGWSFLIRLVPFGGDERLRIVPLLFAAATVVAAYAYLRSLPWPGLLLSRTAAVLGGVSILLMPAMLARNDLKQYTADAFLTLLMWWLVSRLESKWTRRRLIDIGVAATVGFLFSAVGLFVGVAAFASILVVAALRRQWRRAGETAVIGVISGVLLIITFLIFYRPGIPAGLNDYWRGFYLPVGEGGKATFDYLSDHGHILASGLGLVSLTLASLLVLSGVTTLFWLRRSVLAICTPVLLIEMIILGAVKEYPLFDVRTSLFLSTALVVTAAIGVAGIATVVSRAHPAFGIAVAVLAAFLFVINPTVRHGIRQQSIPPENMRTPTDYLAAHKNPGDVVVVPMNSSWGFAYYWDRGTPAPERVDTNVVGFLAVFPDQSDILVASDRTPEAISAVMDEAVAAMTANGPAARIWFVGQHLTVAETAAYLEAAKAHGLVRNQVGPFGPTLFTRK